MELKIMTYNTLFGGFDVGSNKRYDLLIEIINEVNPDILLLQELKNYTNDGNKKLFQL